MFRVLGFRVIDGRGVYCIAYTYVLRGVLGFALQAPTGHQPPTRVQGMELRTKQ